MNKQVNTRPLSKKGRKKRRPSTSVQAAKCTLFTFSIAFCCVVYNIANEQEMASVDETDVIAYHVIGATDTTSTAETSFDTKVITEEETLVETTAFTEEETSVETTAFTEEETSVETTAFTEEETYSETTTPAEEEIPNTCCDVSNELTIADSSKTNNDIQIVSEESEVPETTFASSYMHEIGDQIISSESQTEFLVHDVNVEVSNPLYCSDNAEIESFLTNFELIGVPTNHLSDIPSIFASEINAYDIISELEAAKEKDNGKIYNYVINDRSDISLSEHEIKILCNVIWYESGISSLEGQVGVASVILNRLESDYFPDTVYEIVTQPGQFDTAYAANISENFEPQGLTYLAVMIALSGYDYSMDAIYFYNPELTKNPTTKAWFDTLETTQVIGGHTFKK